jgi:hypothetical protein
MPLYIDRVSDILHDHVEDFKQLEVETQLELDALRNSLDQFKDMDRASVEVAIADIQKPGSRPSDEQSDQPMVIPFQNNWQHHGAAREWAIEKLANVTTFAADGSQITPAREMSIQVGLIQIGWFLNPHSKELQYKKDVAVELLTPREFDIAVDNNIQREVEWQRFNGEVKAIVNFLEDNSRKAAMAFFDGSFVVSFVGGMQPERQQQYTRAVQYLLAKSEETRVPLIGYVDNSFSSDMVTLIQHAVGRTRIIRSSDASLLRQHMQWGDRSRVYFCSRDDEVIENDYYQQICITYLKTTRDNAPARIEFPRWMYDDNIHDNVLDIVRAECIVGLGYPYPLETADATAVLTMQDRERFQRMFQQFAKREEIPLRFSRKSMSKRGRR